jgi:hypothetical protein
VFQVAILRHKRSVGVQLKSWEQVASADPQLDATAIKVAETLAGRPSADAILFLHPRALKDEKLRPKVVDIIARAARADPRARVQLIDMIAEYGPGAKSALPVLKGFVKDDSIETRAAAEKAIVAVKGD